jgi:predicted flap endonuclease-1-like 5' DNA nuclease
MSLLFTIVYAAHANGTHHKLALDALRYLPRSDAEPWRRVFLKYADVYMAGSKAPDDEFKDFKNHVLHVRDGYWGGAPEKAVNWYGHLIEALRDKDFERAVYAAGVLSHYYTDPIHPFHTAQSEAENSVHRAVEWSINRSYDGLRTEGETKHQDKSPELPAGDDWLRAHVIAGAERSNPYYETLITHYDLKTGVREPTSGLNPIARDAVADLLIYAAKGFALVLDRAITEAAVEPPEVSLTAETFLATLKMPAKWITKKIADAETRRQVQAMYDELLATGRVEATLPEDDRVVRDLHQKEVLEPRAATKAMERAKRLAPVVPAAKTPRRTSTLKPAAAAGGRDSGSVAAASKAPESTPLVTENEAQFSPRARIVTEEGSANRGSLARLDTGPRCHLLESDDLERAPSIGPKLAERLALGGIVTVKNFLEADADAVASLLGGGRFDVETVDRWKTEARLVLRVPGLRGTHAQLLAGAGYDSPEKIAGADPVALSASVLLYATTPAGLRILRNGDTPDIEAVTRWVQGAQQALAA